MYEILWNNKPVGKAEIKREGLYYLFFCVCRPEQSGIYRVFVTDGKNEISLGVCVPVGDRFEVKKKIPAKMLQNQNLIFWLVPDMEEKQRFPVKDDMPISCLEKLDHARLEIIKEQKFIVID